MLLIILGIAILLASLFILPHNENFSRLAGVGRIAGLLLLLLGAATSMLVVVPAGAVAVKTLFGKVDNTPIYSGLNIVNPLINTTEFNVKTQNYTMSSAHDEGDKQGDDAIRVLSADGLEVVIDLTVLYRVLPTEAPRILREIGPDYQNTIVRPISRTKIRDNAVYYDAVALYSTRRDEFQTRIFNSISKDFKNRGLVLEQLLIRNIQLPASVKASIESKIS